LTTDLPGPPTPTPVPEGGMDDADFRRFVGRIMADARRRATGDPEPTGQPVGDAHSLGSRRLLRCRVCGRAEPRSADELSRLAAAGWPACCGESLPGAAAPGPALNPHLERRRSRLRPARPWAKAEFRLGPAGSGPDLGLGLLDVSEHGARLRVRAAVRPGDEADVTLWPPGGTDPIRRSGAVVWCRAGDNGSFLAGVRLGRSLSAEELNDLAY
jgi:PilZ domain